MLDRDLLSQMSAAPIDHGKDPPKAGTSPAQHSTPVLSNFAQMLREPMPTAYHLVARLRSELNLSPPPAATASAPSMTSVFPRFSYPDVNL